MKLFEDGDPCFAPMLNALFAAFRGTAVMSGCEASATGTSRTVSITAGSVQINGEVIAVSAGSVTLDAGSTFDRYDLVSVNASGSKIVTKGATKRKCPTQPADTCLLAIVFVPAGATVIATGNVYDARLLASKVVTDTANLGYIAATRIRSEASDTVRYGPKTGNISLTIPSIYMPGSTVRIKFHVYSPYIHDWHYSNTATLKIDGVVVATVTPPIDYYGSTSTAYVGDHTANGGSTITLTSTRPGDTSGITISCTDTAPVTYPAPPTWPA